MLTELLKVLEQSSGEIDLLALSRHLNSHPGAVAGMLEMLIQKGRVSEVGAECGICESCGLQNQCNLPARRARQFQVVKH